MYSTLKPSSVIYLMKQSGIDDLGKVEQNVRNPFELRTITDFDPDTMDKSYHYLSSDFTKDHEISVGHPMTDDEEYEMFQPSKEWLKEFRYLLKHPDLL